MSLQMYKNYASFGTIQVHILHSMKQQNVTRDESFVSVLLRGFVKKLYVFPSPINLSM